MTQHEQILERMGNANPLPDLGSINVTELAALSSLLEQRKTSPTEGRRVLDTPPPAMAVARPAMAVARPAMAFVAALVVVLAAIGIVALLPDVGHDVVDEPPLLTTSLGPTPTSTPPPSMQPMVAAPSGAPLTWVRTRPNDPIFDGEDVGDAGETNASMFDVTSGHGVWVAVGWESGVLGPDIAFMDRAAAWYSVDGFTWTRAGGSPDFGFGDAPWLDGGFHVRGVAATASGFVAVGYEMDDAGSHAAVWTSSNGRTWTHVSHDVEVFGNEGMTEIRGVATKGDLVVAVGRRANAAAAWRSVDGGATWTSVPHDRQVFGQRNTVDEDHDGVGDGLQSIDTVTATGEGFVAGGINDNSGVALQSGDLDAVVWQSATGVLWERVPDATGALGGEGDQLIRSIVVLPERYVAVGSERFSYENLRSHAAVWHSTDLVNWTRVPHNPEHFGTNNDTTQMNQATAGPTGILTVGQTGSDPIRAVAWTSPDGIEWTRIHTPVFGNGTWLSSITAAQSGYIVVGGENTTTDWWNAHAAVWIATPTTN